MRDKDYCECGDVKASINQYCAEFSQKDDLPLDKESYPKKGQVKMTNINKCLECHTAICAPAVMCDICINMKLIDIKDQVNKAKLYVKRDSTYHPPIPTHKIYDNILKEADAITSGSRQESYGKPEKCFQKIAELWNSYLGTKNITAHNVAMMMILLKVARESMNPKRDNLVDIAGYARCIEMMGKE